LRISSCDLVLRDGQGERIRKHAPVRCRIQLSRSGRTHPPPAAAWRRPRPLKQAGPNTVAIDPTDRERRGGEVVAAAATPAKAIAASTGRLRCPQRTVRAKPTDEVRGGAPKPCRDGSAVPISHPPPPARCHGDLRRRTATARLTPAGRNEPSRPVVRPPMTASSEGELEDPLEVLEVLGNRRADPGNGYAAQEPGRSRELEVDRVRQTRRAVVLVDGVLEPSRGDVGLDTSNALASADPCGVY
jgi:hypothetical protein